MRRLVIKKHRPLEIILATMLLSATFSVIVWILLDTAYWNLIKNQLSSNKESRLLWDVNKNIGTENTILREKLIMLERSTQIDNQAAMKLQNDIRLLQDQVYKLKGELEFYQGIMSATTDSKGLNVQGLHIEATDEERIFNFKLVLTNVAKNDKLIEVSMDMTVEGMNEAGTQVLALKDVISGRVPKLDIKFKNFERIEGNLIFPGGFKPLRIVVYLQKKGLQKSTVQRVFEWPANIS